MLIGENTSVKGERDRLKRENEELLKARGEAQKLANEQETNLKKLKS